MRATRYAANAQTGGAKIDASAQVYAPLVYSLIFIVYFVTQNLRSERISAGLKRCNRECKDAVDSEYTLNPM